MALCIQDFVLEADVHRIAHYDPLPTGTLTPRSLSGPHSRVAYPDVLHSRLLKASERIDKNILTYAQVRGKPSTRLSNGHALYLCTECNLATHPVPETSSKSILHHSARKTAFFSHSEQCTHAGWCILGIAARWLVQTMCFFKCSIIHAR